MKILILTNMYPSEQKPASGTFIQEQVEALRKEGVDIDIFLVDGSVHKINYLWGIFRLVTYESDLPVRRFPVIVLFQSVCPHVPVKDIDIDIGIDFLQSQGVLYRFAAAYPTAVVPIFIPATHALYHYQAVSI